MLAVLGNKKGPLRRSVIKISTFLVLWTLKLTNPYDDCGGPAKHKTITLLLGVYSNIAGGQYHYGVLLEITVHENQEEPKIRIEG